jgi:hypothetical protein
MQSEINTANSMSPILKKAYAKERKKPTEDTKYQSKRKFSKIRKMIKQQKK